MWFIKPLTRVVLYPFVMFRRGWRWLWSYNRSMWVQLIALFLLAGAGLGPLLYFSAESEHKTELKCTIRGGVMVSGKCLANVKVIELDP